MCLAHGAQVFAQPRSGGGSGLGLAIARENALLLGARLGVRSEPGRTEFRLDVPAAPPLPDGAPGDTRDGDADPGEPDPGEEASP